MSKKLNGFKYENNCNKERIVNEIIDEIKTAKNMKILCKIQDILKDELPILIRDYIDDNWSEYSEGFRDDLEHEIRKFWIKTGPGCKPEGYLIAPCSTELPTHWLDICIENDPSDIWVMEQGTSFNPVDIAMMLFEIYMGKVVF